MIEINVGHGLGWAGNRAGVKNSDLIPFRTWRCHDDRMLLALLLLINFCLDL